MSPLKRRIPESPNMVRRAYPVDHPPEAEPVEEAPPEALIQPAGPPPAPARPQLVTAPPAEEPDPESATETETAPVAGSLGRRPGRRATVSLVDMPIRRTDAEQRRRQVIEHDIVVAPPRTAPAPLTEPPDHQEPASPEPAPVAASSLAHPDPAPAPSLTPAPGPAPAIPAWSALDAGRPQTALAIARRHATRAWVLIALLVALGALSSPHALSLLRKVNLLGSPEQFTALALVNPSSLPSSYTPGQPITFTFQLANHEGSHQDYRWQVALTAGGATTVLETGQANLGDGRTAEVGASITIPAGIGPGVVTVFLVDRTETVHFIVVPSA